MRDFDASEAVLVRHLAELPGMRKMTYPAAPSLEAALHAATTLAIRALDASIANAQIAAIDVVTTNEHVPAKSKSLIFYKRLVPWRRELVTLHADCHRRLFKLAIANPRVTEGNPEKWAWNLLRPLVDQTWRAIVDWYLLACDGANRWVQPVGQFEITGNNQTDALPVSTVDLSVPAPWRAPAWLFQVSDVHFGIGRMKTEHVPANDTDERLSPAHSRLILMGSRRVFLRELCVALDTVHNEEIAAAGATVASPEISHTRPLNKRDGWQLREKLYTLIRRILNEKPSLQGLDFCRELDRHHARPLRDWEKSRQWREGLTFQEAWGTPILKKKIRRVRQEAMGPKR